MKEATCIGTRWFEEVWNQRKAETIYELLAPHSVAHSGAKNLHGPEAWEQMQRDVLQAVPDLHVTIEDVVSTPTHCIVRWNFCGTAGAPGGDHETCPLHYHGMTWFRLEDGKIVEGWDYWDKTAFVQDLQKVTSIPETLVA